MTITEIPTTTTVEVETTIAVDHTFNTDDVIQNRYGTQRRIVRTVDIIDGEPHYRLYPIIGQFGGVGGVDTTLPLDLSVDYVENNYTLADPAEGKHPVGTKIGDDGDWRYTIDGYRWHVTDRGTVVVQARLLCGPHCGFTSEVGDEFGWFDWVDDVDGYGVVDEADEPTEPTMDPTVFMIAVPTRPSDCGLRLRLNERLLEAAQDFLDERGVDRELRSTYISKEDGVSDVAVRRVVNNLIGIVEV